MNREILVFNELNTINKDFKIYIKQIKVLSRKEEYNLAKKFKDEKNLEAAKKLIEANLIIVIKVARNYLGYGLVLSDLIQEGTIGLMKAVKKFDPDKGIRLISFAIHWIKAEINEYIIKNSRIVRIATTKAQRKLFFNLKKIKNIGWLNNNEIKSISETLNIKQKEIKYMEKRLNKQDVRIDGAINTNEPYNNIEKYIISNKYNPIKYLEKENWNYYINNKLKNALDELDDRSKDIIQKRWLNEKRSTLRELANIYKVSPERIRQLENNSIKKIKKNLI